MSDTSQGCCCGSNSDCCSPKPKKDLTIDFLYLDLTVCSRCQETESKLDQAIKEVSALLTSAGYSIHVNKVNITSKELAVKYEFVSSPTIRINGTDIALEVKESHCTECGDLCGENVDCRVWEYEGNEYTEPPKELIVNAILKDVYGGGNQTAPKSPYRLPNNLKVFFEGKSK